MFAHAVEYRIFILCASPLPFAFPAARTRLPGPALGVVGRRAGSSGAVGVGRHYSIWKGLYGPYAALARNFELVTSSSHRCLLARTMILSAVRLVDSA